MSSRLPTVAIINTSTDTIDMLRMFFEQAGFVVVSTSTILLRDGEVDLRAFLSSHKPDVLLYDISLPYDVNWRLFCHIRESMNIKVPTVITTTNVKHVQPLAGDVYIHEIVGKPYDLDKLLEIVKSTIKH
jgi:DNA-binding response OmpR family regulator